MLSSSTPLEPRLSQSQHGTRRVLDKHHTAAACFLQMKNLQCFMYVSTAYSNAHVKKYTTVKEQLYPLQEPNGQEVDHAAIVDRLLAMPVEEAQSKVHTCRLWCLLLQSKSQFPSWCHLLIRRGGPKGGLLRHHSQTLYPMGTVLHSLLLGLLASLVCKV